MSIKEDRNKETAPVALNAVFLFIFSPIYIMSKMEFAKRRKWTVVMGMLVIIVGVGVFFITAILNLALCNRLILYYNNKRHFKGSKEAE